MIGKFRNLAGTNRLLKKCFPALFQRAESGTGPDSASLDQALAVLDPRQVIHDLRKQGVSQHPANQSACRGDTHATCVMYDSNPTKFLQGRCRRVSAQGLEALSQNVVSIHLEAAAGGLLMKARFRISTATFAVFCSFLVVGLLGIYLKMALLDNQWLSIARFLGKTHADQITLLQRLGFYFNDIVIDLVLAPLIATTVVGFVFRRYRAGAAAIIAMMVSVLLFYELRAQTDVGQYVSRAFMVDSVGFGLSNPAIAGDYATTSSMIKLLIILAAIVTIWLIARAAQRKERADGAHRGPYRFLLMAPAFGIWLVAVLVTPLSFAHRLHGSLLNTSSTGRVARALLVPDAGHGATGLDFKQALIAMRELTHTPALDTNNPLVGSERNANVLVFIMETGPAQALDFSTAGRELPGVSALYDHSFITTRHYTTYPYTSNAIYSILSGFYPQGRRRLLDDLKHRTLNGLMTALAPDIPVRRVYMPSLYLSEVDNQMYRAFGANGLYVSSQHPDGPLNAAAQRRANELISRLEQGGSIFDKKTRDLLRERLVEDFQALDKMKADITDAVHANQRFCVIYMPQVGHGPWIALHNESTVLARGHDLMLLEDQWLEELVNTLRGLNQLNNTVIVFTADHGIRTRVEDPSLPTGKISDYMFRVPLLIYAPNSLQHAELIDAPSSHIDVAPTVLALLGYPGAAEQMEGIPLWQRTPSDRIYFWAGTYGGADGFEENGSYYMRQELEGLVYRSDYTGFYKGFPEYTMVKPGDNVTSSVTNALSKANALQEAVVSDWIRKKNTAGQ